MESARGVQILRETTCISLCANGKGMNPSVLPLASKADWAL